MQRFQHVPIDSTTPPRIVVSKARHKICYFLNSPRLVGLHLCCSWIYNVTTTSRIWGFSTKTQRIFQIFGEKTSKVCKKIKKKQLRLQRGRGEFALDFCWPFQKERIFGRAVIYWGAKSESGSTLKVKIMLTIYEPNSLSKMGKKNAKKSGDLDPEELLGRPRNPYCARSVHKREPYAWPRRSKVSTRWKA